MQRSRGYIYVIIVSLQERDTMSCTPLDLIEKTMQDPAAAIFCFVFESCPLRHWLFQLLDEQLMVLPWLSVKSFKLFSGNQPQCLHHRTEQVSATC